MDHMMSPESQGEKPKRVEREIHTLTCLICNEDGFKNLTGHIVRKHKVTTAEYRSQTGYTGPLIAPAHARVMATISNRMWANPETRQRRIAGVANSYTSSLRQERSQAA